MKFHHGMMRSLSKKSIFFFLCVWGMCLCTACIMTEETGAEIQQKKMSAVFSNIDLLNSEQIDFITISRKEAEEQLHRGIYSHSCKRDNINTIFCKKRDYYEAVFRIYQYIGQMSETYITTDICLREEEITESREGHYVQLDLKEPVSVLVGDRQIQELGRLLYNVDNGELWLCTDGENYTIAAQLPEQSDFTGDTELAGYVEGKWERPPYHTIVEGIYYTVNGGLPQ